MKILFVAREGKTTIFKTVVQNQYNSLLTDKDLDMHGFAVEGKGLIAYFKAYKPLKKMVKEIKPDIVHAHYSFSGFLAALALRKMPVVVSLMGSDVEGGSLRKKAIQWFSKHRWLATIVKSESLKQKIGNAKLAVLPNGVDTEKFNPQDILECKRKLNWNPEKKQLLFLADPKRPEKNYELASQAVQKLNNKMLELKVVHNVPSNDTPLYLNAADVVLLSSLWEGSPNVIKEAMACNRPMVSTKVGDVEMLLEKVEGAFLSGFETTEFSEKITEALGFEKSSGRQKIQQLQLDSKSIVLRLKEIYKQYGK